MKNILSRMTMFAAVVAVGAIVVLAAPSYSFAQATAPAPTAAQSEEQIVKDLESQIQSLLGEINGLQSELAQAQAGSPSTGSGSASGGGGGGGGGFPTPGVPQPAPSGGGGEGEGACVTLTRDLKRGDTGTEVAKLISMLVAGGYGGLTAGDVATAIFGPKTEAAVKQFQQRYANEVLTPYGITRPTGYVGAATRAKLNQLYGCPQGTGSLSLVILGVENVIFKQGGWTKAGSVIEIGPNTPIDMEVTVRNTGTADAGPWEIKTKNATNNWDMGGSSYSSLAPGRGQVVTARWSSPFWAVSGENTIVIELYQRGVLVATWRQSVTLGVAQIIKPGEVSSQATVQVSLDSALSPPARQVAMGSTNVTLAAWRFTETTNVEDAIMSDFRVQQLVDGVGLTSGFSRLTLYSADNPNVALATAGAALGTGGIYYYDFHFSSSPKIPKGGSITLVLKGDVASYAANAVKDNSVHYFDVVKDDSFWAVGATSNNRATVSLGSSRSNSVTVVRTLSGGVSTSTPPSIRLSVSSGEKSSDSVLNVPIGSTFQISGTPQNLQGLPYN
ncbi:MAG: peptidoglycan-binding protein, partial [Candidatus Harrisonbacteria bacterium]|nr:peptidoglycan-binding protein [Candidatus Harrisonbacteria bacterium]